MEKRIDGEKTRIYHETNKRINVIQSIRIISATCLRWSDMETHNMTGTESLGGSKVFHYYRTQGFNSWLRWSFKDDTIQMNKYTSGSPTLDFLSGPPATSRPLHKNGRSFVSAVGWAAQWYVAWSPHEYTTGSPLCKPAQKLFYSVIISR